MSKAKGLAGVPARALEELTSGARTLEGLLSELESAKKQKALLKSESARADAENEILEGQLRVRLDKLRAEQGKNDNALVRSEISSIEDLLRQREELKAEKLGAGHLREEPFFSREEYLAARKAFEDHEVRENEMLKQDLAKLAGVFELICYVDQTVKMAKSLEEEAGRLLDDYVSYKGNRGFFNQVLIGQVFDVPPAPSEGE